MNRFNALTARGEVFQRCGLDHHKMVSSIMYQMTVSTGRTIVRKCSDNVIIDTLPERDGRDVLAKYRELQADGKHLIK